MTKVNPTNRNRNYQPVHLYPYTTTDIDSTRYHAIKRIHIIRHAEGTHNVNKEYKDIKNLDAKLTELGKQQCQQLSQRLLETKDGFIPKIDLVVTSPLTRCLQTALLSFPTLPQSKIPFVAHESIRETVNYACDRRRAIQELEDDCFHDHVDFQSILHSHDEIWDAYERRLGSPEQYSTHRESAELHVVADRARDFFDWLASIPQQEIVVCTHSAFLRAFLNWGQEGGVPLMMEQCLDERETKPKAEIPVVQYCGGDDAEWETFMRSDYDNCELRSCIVAFPSMDDETTKRHTV